MKLPRCKLLPSILKLYWLIGFSLLSASTLAEDGVWHGFISQGLIQAQESNFVNNDGDVSWQLTELGVNSVYKLHSDVKIAGQLMYLDGGNRYVDGVRIDYLFLNWTSINHLDWQLDFYAGRFKNMHWLYSSTRDVALTRPLIVLPQSVYFDSFRDIAVGSDGLALRSTHNLALGELELNWSWGATPISRDMSSRVISNDILGKTDQKFVHQMSAYLRPNASQMQWGISLLDSDFSYRRASLDRYADGDFTVQRVMLNWRYSAENWELSSELMQERVNIAGFIFPQFARNQFAQGAFLLGRYNWSPTTTLYLSYDYFIANKDNPSGSELPASSGGLIPSYFGYQKDAAISVDHELAKNLRFKVEYHLISGTGRLGPNVVPNIVVNDSKDHDIWALQLLYWF